LYGSELVKRLERYGHQIHHQTGSHIIIRMGEPSEHSVSIPNHKPLKAGILNSIINDVADHLGLDKEEVLERLMARK
jgi:predicted RNA binding protein YcfA (HicA-like mRNA interferase family)